MGVFGNLFGGEPLIWERFKDDKMSKSLHKGEMSRGKNKSKRKKAKRASKVYKK